MLKSEMVFGKLQAWLYSIEWQKHGLPHCHLLLWLSAEHRITPDKIDNVICAEIPDPSADNLTQMPENWLSYACLNHKNY